MPRGRQNAAHPGFVAPDRPYDCEQCIGHHAEKFGFPMLEPEDRVAWDLYMAVQDQQRAAGLGELIGLDYSVLPAVWDVYGIARAERREVFERLTIINRCVQENANRKRAIEEAQRKAKELAKTVQGASQ